MNIGKELALAAKKYGLCEEWFDEMKPLKDKGKLLDMYVRGIDFCLANDYPSNDYIRKHFKGEMEAFGVHLDDSIEALNPERIIALGESSGRIVVDSYNVCEVFVKHSSCMTIEAKGHSFVMIDVFDDTRLNVTGSEEAKVCVNRYGGEISFNQEGNSRIKIVEKHKKTY